MQSCAYSEDCRYAIFQDRNTQCLAHYQIPGAKHGQRRFQNYDGSLTPEGRARYGVGPPREKIGVVDKSGQSITISGKNISEIKNRVKAKLNDISNRRREKAFEKSLAKEQERKARDERKASEKLAKEAKEEADRKAAEEAEKDAQKAKIDALKRYYRDHPLQIYSARDYLSEEDIKDVQKQIRLDRELKDFRREEYMRYARTFHDVTGVVEDAYKTADNFKKFYNVGAETYNSLIAARDPNDNKKPIRLIGTDQHRPKKPTDASTDKRQDKKPKNENQNEKPEDIAAAVKKQMGDIEKKSSSNAQTAKVKKDYENLANKVKSDKPTYKEKITTKDGTVRYFYDEEEYKGYRDAQKNLTGKAMRAYTTASTNEKMDWSRSLSSIVTERMKNNTLTKADYGKYNAIMDAVADYHYVMRANDPDNKK